MLIGDSGRAPASPEQHLSSGATASFSSSAPRCGHRSLWCEPCAARCRHDSIAPQAELRCWRSSRRAPGRSRARPCCPTYAARPRPRLLTPAMDALTKGPRQRGAPAGTVPCRISIGWGRRDLVTVSRQHPAGAWDRPRRARGGQTSRADRLARQPTPRKGNTTRSVWLACPQLEEPGRARRAQGPGAGWRLSSRRPHPPPGRRYRRPGRCRRHRPCDCMPR